MHDLSFPNRQVTPFNIIVPIARVTLFLIFSHLLYILTDTQTQLILSKMSLDAIETVCSWCQKHFDDTSNIVDGFTFPSATMCIEDGGDDDDDDDVVYDYAPAA